MAQRENWSRHVADIIRSRHYTWIAEGLAGLPPREALTQILTDVMHICREQDIEFDDLLAECQEHCDAEESGVLVVGR